MIPSSRPKRSDLYTLSQSKLLENHTLHSGTYLYNPYMAVPPRALNQQRYDLLSQKQECSTAYSTRISKVQVLNDQALFLC